MDDFHFDSPTLDAMDAFGAPQMAELFDVYNNLHFSSTPGDVSTYVCPTSIVGRGEIVCRKESWFSSVSFGMVMMDYLLSSSFSPYL